MSAAMQSANATARAFASSRRGHASLTEVLASAGITHEAPSDSAQGRRVRFPDGSAPVLTAGAAWHWVWTGRLPTDEEAGACTKCGAVEGERCQVDEGGLCSREAA